MAKKVTNWDYMKLAIDGEIDDGGASYEATIHYSIACPYFYGDPRAKCNGKDVEPNRDLCVECKEQWLNDEYE